MDCGVPIALCIGLAPPLATCVKPGEGTCWRATRGCGEDVICWLSEEGVREGICRMARLLGDRRSDGDGIVGCGVGVPAGESDGDRRELISMMRSEDALVQRLIG